MSWVKTDSSQGPALSPISTENDSTPVHPIVSGAVMSLWSVAVTLQGRWWVRQRIGLHGDYLPGKDVCGFGVQKQKWRLGRGLHW